MRMTPRTILTDSIQNDHARRIFDEQMFASTANSIAEESKNDQMARVGLAILPGINRANYYNSAEFT